MRRHRIIAVCLTLIILIGGIIGMMHWRGRPVVLEMDTNLPFALEESLQGALYYASLAPSSHNTQMWKVGINPEERTMTVRLDKKRLLTEVDPEGREAWISLGAFVENLRQALAAYSYQTEIEIRQQPDQDAIVVLRYSGGQKMPLDTAVLANMEQRHSDKREFGEKPLPQEDVSALQQLADGKLSYAAKGTEDFTFLSDGTAHAMQQQSAAQEKRDELAEWLRFSDKETMQKRDGLSAEQLGMTGVKKFFYYGFMNREAARKESYAAQGNTLAKGQAAHCAGFFVLRGGGTPEQLIRTGMQLEAVWLEGTRRGISFHPMSQMIEEEPFRTQLQQRWGEEEPVQMVLRAGFAAPYGENYKIRRNLASFVVLE